ncbi:DUF956 family protein [Lactococcus nasutitermitis]|uniref:DUF956 family protein n=1 Tax=Lactococcus nasutitermitis TaxID=1652957 RepID=A0ABV9JFG3_9LACT|nr:DUF956 family protein [Lactococcus nasutitermitis]
METQRTQMVYETDGQVYLSTVEPGKIRLDNNGFEFKYKNSHMGKNLFFKWETISKAEIDISLRGKVRPQFAIILNGQSRIRFFSKNSGAILKRMGKEIGTKNISRTPSLLDALTRGLRN